MSARVDLPLDRIAALVIVAVVAYTGWQLLRDAVRVLLDASLDSRTLDSLRQAIATDSSVTEVKWLTGRDAGRCQFVEAGVSLRSSDLAHVHAAVRRIEQSVRTAIPRIERVLVHIEPATSTQRRYAVPLADADGTLSEHFGEAPYFAFLTLDGIDSTIKDRRIEPNPHGQLEKGKGIRVAEWLVAEKIGALLVKRSLEGRGPSYLLRDVGVEITITDRNSLGELFREPRQAAKAE